MRGQLLERSALRPAGFNDRAPALGDAPLAGKELADLRARLFSSCQRYSGAGSAATSATTPADRAAAATQRPAPGAGLSGEIGRASARPASAPQTSPPRCAALSIPGIRKPMPIVAAANAAAPPNSQRGIRPVNLAPFAPQRDQQRAIRAENRARSAAGDRAVAVRKQREQVSGNTAGRIDGEEARVAVSRSTIPAAIRKRPQVNREVQQPEMHEHRRAEAPPFAVARRRAELAPARAARRSAHATARRHGPA